MGRLAVSTILPPTWSACRLTSSWLKTLTPTRAAMNATKTIPIVMTFPGDPVLMGFVASLERPGGNVTGVSGLTLELGGKWLELVKETVPSAKRVAGSLESGTQKTAFRLEKYGILPLVLSGVDIEWVEVRAIILVISDAGSVGDRADGRFHRAAGCRCR